MFHFIRFVFFVFLPVSFAVADSEVFSAPTKEASELVELFEFNSPELQNVAVNLAKSLRCPQCQNQNLVESNSPIAKDLRYIVFTKINQGQSEQQVIDFMTQRYGDFVLYNPPKSLKNIILWGAPIGLLMIFCVYSYRSVKRNEGQMRDE
ncbi:heme lyase NrfEFG subunit NrfF [Vibrio sp. ZSDE26]|uniref:Formate-dependent nitrite reductase complex subunit n=1 Tax=Vibrio amylolyticus TaxID=2847292 RepID=A0A9X2BN09_9VIBR|nr:heme lyase NrfEFG subunit NrfF [Vibrio amylolyticus]MCK6265463.1 heme lyase NrfEFG subunit NrfF [Vibrio amylolyticus]